MSKCLEGITLQDIDVYAQLHLTEEQLAEYNKIKEEYAEKPDYLGAALKCALIGLVIVASVSIGALMGQRVVDKYSSD